MEKEQIQLLQRMAIFGGIQAEIVELVLRESKVADVSRDEYFFREAEPGHSMFVLETGRVAVLKAWAGTDYLLNYLDAGDCFGEMALIDMCPRSASVQAVDDCTAIEISGAALLAVYKENLEQFTMIQMNMGREVSRRLRVADQRLLQARVENRLTEGEYQFRPV